MAPETVSRINVYQDAVLGVEHRDYVEGDRAFSRVIVLRPAAAVILAVKPAPGSPTLFKSRYISDYEIGMVTQFRAPAGTELLELPAGTADPNESTNATAQRECEEELGWFPKKVKFIHSFYSSPGFLDERMDLFLCTGLVRTDQNLDSDEHVTVKWLPYETVHAMVMRGEIVDAKTMVGVLLLKEVWKNG